MLSVLPTVRMRRMNPQKCPPTANFVELPIRTGLYEYLSAPGSMKTYWLDRHELRMPLARRASSVGTRSEGDRERGSTLGLATLGDERPVYSPVTFQDIARRSAANSPVKANKQRGKDVVLLSFNLVFVVSVLCSI